MKQKIAQIQVDNNSPGLERLVKLVDQKYPEISRRDVKNFLRDDVITKPKDNTNQGNRTKTKEDT